MSWFKKKEETTTFERDEEGNLVNIKRNGEDVDPEQWKEEHKKYKPTRQLLKEHYKRHPEEEHPTLQKVGKVARRMDDMILGPPRPSRPRKVVVYYSRPPRRTKRQRSQRQYSSFNPMDMPYPIVGGTRGKQKKPKYIDPFDPFNTKRFFG